MPSKDDDFPQIKRELIDSVHQIKMYITTNSALLEDIQTKLWGDSKKNPPIFGHEQRIIYLEEIERQRAKTRDMITKTAIGAVTIAVGSIVLWIFGVLKAAIIGLFGGKHG